jgi:hypothetical protein
MSSPAFVQVEPTELHNRYVEAIAVTCVQTDRFSRDFGLAFFDGVDNLDAYKGALIRLRSGRFVGLVRHVGARDPGTEVHVEMDDDFVSALREFLDAFDLSVEDLSWMREEIAAEDLRLTAQGAHS